MLLPGTPGYRCSGTTGWGWGCELWILCHLWCLCFSKLHRRNGGQVGTEQDSQNIIDIEESPSSPMCAFTYPIPTLSCAEAPARATVRSRGGFTNQKMTIGLDHAGEGPRSSRSSGQSSGYSLPVPSLCHRQKIRGRCLTADLAVSLGTPEDLSVFSQEIKIIGRKCSQLFILATKENEEGCL